MPPPRSADDRTARSRIREAALVRFAHQGYAATSVKTIAADAGVSTALVFHHFGSKEGLRAACDAYVLELVEEQERDVMRAGPRLDVFGTLRQLDSGPPVLPYLARMLTDGSPAADALVDGMVGVAETAWQEGVRSGVLRAVDDPRDLNVVLVLWSLGLLTLKDHAQRLLGIDITGDATQRARYVRIAMEALRGLFSTEAYETGRQMPAGADRRKAGDDERL